MWRRTDIAVSMAVLAIAPVLAGCESEQVFVAEREPVNRIPVFVATLPADVTPNTWVGGTVEFSVSASDPDGDELTFSFTVDDSVVSNSSIYVYAAEQPGTRHVMATVSDGSMSIDNEWWLTVHALRDSIAPAEVTILSVEPGPQPHEVAIEWLAVGDDGMAGRAAGYVVGVRSQPIEDAADWAAAVKHELDGKDADPGTVMSLVVSRNEAAGFTAVVVRAVDEQDNMSPRGQYVSGYTRGYSYAGEVQDAMTGQPVAGALITGGLRTVTSGPDGGWQLTEMPIVTTGLQISEDGVGGVVGSHFDYVVEQPNQHGAYFAVKLIPAVELRSTRYSNFLSFFNGITQYAGQPNMPFNSYLRHWDHPIDIYVPPFEKDGLDYKETIERVALGLEADIGFAAFRIVEQPPAVGIRTSYLDPSSTLRDNFGVREWTSDWYPVVGDLEFRSRYEPRDIRAFERVIRHELGHALGLAHSTDPIHLMVGGLLAPQVDTFSTDEIVVLQLIHSLPRGYPVGSYRYE